MFWQITVDECEGRTTPFKMIGAIQEQVIGFI